MTLVVFWALVGLVAYAYFGYPPTVAVAGLLLDRKVRKAPFTPPSASALSLSEYGPRQ